MFLRPNGLGATGRVGKLKRTDKWNITLLVFMFSRDLLTIRKIQNNPKPIKSLWKTIQKPAELTLIVLICSFAQMEMYERVRIIVIIDVPDICRLHGHTQTPVNTRTCTQKQTHASTRLKSQTRRRKHFSSKSCSLTFCSQNKLTELTGYSVSKPHHQLPSMKYLLKTLHVYVCVCAHTHP